jgi:hypothetical protein
LLVEIVVGFIEPSYTITESGGQQEVCAEIKSGNLSTSAAVQFSTADGGAIGNFFVLYRMALAKV